MSDKPALAKLHFRPQRNGLIYVQGVIPANEAAKLVSISGMTDAIAAVHISLLEVRDRSEQYVGKSNSVIASEGFV